MNTINSAINSASRVVNNAVDEVKEDIHTIGSNISHAISSAKDNITNATTNMPIHTFNNSNFDATLFGALDVPSNVLPLIHTHDGRPCEVSQKNQDILEHRQREWERINSVSTKVDEKSRTRQNEAATELANKQREAQALLNSSSQPQLNLGPIEGKINTLMHKLERNNAIPALDTRDLSTQYLSTVNQLERLPAVQKFDPTYYENQKRDIQAQLDTKLRDLDSRAGSLRAPQAATLSVDIESSQAKIQQERAQQMREHENNMQVIANAKAGHSADAEKHNAMLRDRLREAQNQFSSVVGTLRGIEDQSQALQQQIAQVQNIPMNPAGSSALQNLKNQLNNQIANKNTWGDLIEQDSREIWGIKEDSARRQFDLQDMNAREQHALSEERRLGQHRLNNTQVHVDLDVPVQRTAMQKGFATKKDVVLVPTVVSRVVPVETPVTFTENVTTHADLGSVGTRPFEAHDYRAREYAPSVWSKPAIPAPMPFPVERAVVEEAPRCVDVQVQRTVFNEIEVPVTHKVIKPSIVFEEKSHDIPLERIVTKRQVQHVDLPAVPVEGFERTTTTTTTTYGEPNVQHYHTSEPAQRWTYSSRNVSSNNASNINPNANDKKNWFSSWW